jgi:hypothetical protein
MPLGINYNQRGQWPVILWRPPSNLALGNDPAGNGAGAAFTGAEPSLSEGQPMRDFPTQSTTLLLVEHPDARLLPVAAECGGTIVTNDATLRQTAEEQGIPVMALHEFALALAPKVRRGDEIEVEIIKPGQNRNEGIAYLDDGTMVVVEGGQRHVGAKRTVTVTGILQNTAGKMVFATLQ